MTHNVSNVDANETSNHVLFKCPPTVQVCALSNVRTNPYRFSMKSIYANMDYLFRGSLLTLMTIDFLGLCGIYMEKDVSIRFLTVLIRILEIFYSWQRHKPYFGMMHKYQCSKLEHKYYLVKLGWR